MQAQVLSAADARCDASRSMRGLPPPHPSRRAHARPDLRQRFRTRAPQDEAAQGIPNSRFVAEPFSVIPNSRCQTAHLVPAAHFCARGLQLRFTNPESRGGRSAERRAGARRNTREARRIAARQALARRLASHDAGRSPLGAPPWRFWASGPRFSHRHPPLLTLRRASDRAQRAPRSQVIVPGGRGPGPPGASGYKPPPQDATPRSAFRMSPETPLKERGCDSDSIGTLRSQ